MSPSNKIRQKMIFIVTGEILHENEIDEKWSQEDLQDGFSDARYSLELVPTDLECETSRHYESEAVACQMLDGSWVGWTSWYGGGKHGEPESIPWIEDAYDLDCKEVVKTVREFTKR